MSKPQLRTLPLGDAPTLVSDDSKMLTAWESVNVWAVQMGEQNTPTVFRSFASYIMLACRYIVLRLDTLRTEQDAMQKPTISRARMNGLYNTVRQAYNELSKLDVVKESVGEQTSLQVASDLGRSIYDTLRKPKEEWVESGFIDPSRLQPVLRIWELISIHTEVEPDAKIISRGEIKSKVRWLKRQLNLPEEKAAGEKHGHDQENLEGEPEVSKKAKLDIDQQLEIPRTPEATAILGRYVWDVGTVPVHGKMKSPVVVTAKDLATLMINEWLNDVVVDAYLALLCHTHNGHTRDDTVLGKSPKWQAWNAYTLQTLQDNKGEMGGQWPPKLYPEAALEDVECHFFPICQRNHWHLGVINRAGDGFQVLYLSSAPGWQEDFESAWSLIAEFLATKSEGRLDLRNSAIQFPDPQPRQKNSNDCGVFLLASVRWAYEGWDLADLTTSRIPDLRYRMIYELESWEIGA